jgi:large subunit ribosomal protein L6
MSRIGKNPVSLPDGVECQIENGVIRVKGKLGQLATHLNDNVTVTVDDRTIIVKPASDSKEAHSMWGTTRANIANIVKGVSEGFVKNLEINGVGYRANVQGSNLVLQLGFSHDVNHPIPEGVQVTVEKQTAVKIEGIDKQVIGQFAAEVRAYRPPEPYKGKGVKYADEHIVRKEGKKK